MPNLLNAHQKCVWMLTLEVTTHSLTHESWGFFLIPMGPTKKQFSLKFHMTHSLLSVSTYWVKSTLRCASQVTRQKPPNDKVLNTSFLPLHMEVCLTFIQRTRIGGQNDNCSGKSKFKEELSAILNCLINVGYHIELCMLL